MRRTYLFAAILAEKPVTLTNVPELKDIDTAFLKFYVVYGRNSGT